MYVARTCIFHANGLRVPLRQMDLQIFETIRCTGASSALISFAHCRLLTLVRLVFLVLQGSDVVSHCANSSEIATVAPTFTFLLFFFAKSQLNHVSKSNPMN